MLRSHANILLYGERDYLEPTSIPKYINQLDKPSIFHPMLIKKNYRSNRKEKLSKEEIYFIDICRFNHQILPQGYPKSPVIGCAGLVNASNRRIIKYARSYPGGTFEGRACIRSNVRWRNKTGVALKMNSHMDMVNRDNHEPAPYRYYCQNDYMSFYGFYLLRQEKGDIPCNLAIMDLPTTKYEYPLIIEDCSFCKDGSFFSSGEVILVNGKVWPNLDIKRRQYRFYILNGSASRFFRLMLSNEMSFTVIGGDKGLLNSPIRKKEILLAPGEIVDLLIDFSRQPKGRKIILNNNASLPYPVGELPNPETCGQIMRFSIPENDAISISPIELPHKLRL
jgi:hypothetical protein